MNKVVLMGRLCDDVEVNKTSKKNVYANFTLAVRDGLDEDGESKAQFIRCVAFNKSAEVISEYTSKGSPLCISGRIANSSYENDEGEKKYSTNIIVEAFDLIGSKTEDKKENKKENKKGKYHK